MAQKPHEPSEKERKMVESMAGFGFAENEIARVLEITVPTLAKYYRTELDTGHLKANTQVAASLFRKCLGDGPQAVTACIFWLKTRMPQVFGMMGEPERYQSKKEEAQWQAKRAGLGSEWDADLIKTPSPRQIQPPIN